MRYNPVHTCGSGCREKSLGFERIVDVLSIEFPIDHAEHQTAANNELTRMLGAHLRHHVADIAVECDCKNAVMVTGRSKTYHGKQLATHALQGALPGIRIRNEIVVARDTQQVC